MFEPLPTMVRLERERQGLSQLALANLAGLSRNTIVTLEAGEENVSLAVLLKIARALKMTELRVGDLDLVPASPDVRVLLLATEAIELAEDVLDHADTSRQDLARLSASISGLLHKSLQPGRLRDDAGVGKAAERLASRPADGSTGRALRELAEGADRVPRSPARAKQGAKAAARRRSR